MKICVLVKEVPDAAVEKRMDPHSKRIDRSGEKNLNPFDTHAIEAAMQIREGGAVDVDEIVAVTMGPESAFRALHKAVSLGADRSVHLTDDALAGSDVCATGYALAKVLEAESPDLVLLGQQSDDGECYTIGAVVADHLKMPSLTQVIKIDTEEGKLRCERQAEYGYDTVDVELPAVISVGDAINEPRYPSLKAIMGAKKKQLDKRSTGDVGIEADRVGEQGSRTSVLAINPPPAKQAGEIIEDEDTNETVEKIVAWLDERKLSGMSVLTYALHYEGEFNKNSLGAVSEGAGSRGARRPGRRVVVGGDDLTDELCATLGKYGAEKVYRAKAPEGLGAAGGRRHGQGHPGRGLQVRALRGRPAGLRDRRRAHRAPQAGVTMEVTAVKVQDGELVAERPILQDSADRGRGLRGRAGIIIGRLNAFDTRRPATARPRWWTSTSS